MTGRIGRVIVVSLVLASLVGAATPASGSGTPPSVVVVGSITTVHPTGAPSGPQVATITAARNEFESFQVVIEAGTKPLKHVTVRVVSALTGPGGTIPKANITIYREAYYEALTASDGEGGTGLWPDALIPIRDVFYGEKRNAFPIRVPSGQNRVAWVDVLVPIDQAGGTYDGALSVTAKGFAVSVPIHLTVLDFTLPSTPTLQSVFGFASYACPAHYGAAGCPSDTERWELYSLYLRAGLEDRISISPPADEPPTTKTTRRLFKRYILPMLQGSSPQNAAGTLTSVRLPGAQLQTIVEEPLFLKIGGDGSCCVPNPDNPCSDKCLNAYQSLGAKYGFADRFLIDPRDEPGANQEAWAQFKMNRTEALQTFPGLADRGVLATTEIQLAEANHATDQIDVMAAIVNFMDDKPGSPFGNPKGSFVGNQRPKYDPFLQSDPGNRVWLYTSCFSDGCDRANSDDPYWDGWPGYVIDEPAAEQRAMGWLQFIHGTSGELYYDVASTLRSCPNFPDCTEIQRPWQPGAQFYADGNGDGNLFYPGIPHPGGRGIKGVPAIGGKDDIPIESIRLKRIRDSYEDYEYLHFLAMHGQADAALSVAQTLFPRMFLTSVTQQALDQARQQLIALIEQLPSSG